MKFTALKLRGAHLIEVDKISDERGFFGRAWCQQEIEQQGLNGKIAQINISRSKDKGTLRGPHYQVAPYQECKTIRCTKGVIFNFIVDLRPQSATFLQWFGIELSCQNHQALYSPEGFAQGFITLQDDTEIMYSTSQFYQPGYDWGLRWNDPRVNIKLPIEPAVISDKDKNWPDFDQRFLSKENLGK